MNLHLLHTLSGIAVLLSIFCKLIIHLYIDYLQEKNTNLYSILSSPFSYFLPCRFSGNCDYGKLNFLCNFFLLLTALSLILNICAGILILY